jgi:glycosyltransferase involved in cell wall biosynthesis
LGSVDVLTTDFDHQRKKRRDRDQWDVVTSIIYLDTPGYSKNVGIQRFVSHLRFASRAARYFRENAGEYDVVYATAPFNRLAAMLFAAAHRHTKILDVVDVWPDSLPFSPSMRALAWPLLRAWKRQFHAACSRAQVLLAVTDAFLSDGLRHFGGRSEDAARFYLTHQALPAKEVTPDGWTTIVYVGNIGRLYDFETLISALRRPRLNSAYRIFLVGDGDRRDWLLEALGRHNISFEYFGTVYDPMKLAGILKRCQVGFNGFRNSSAAFSYKAATYLAASLPLVNSMTGDLHRLVSEHNIGVNYKFGDAESLVNALGHFETVGPEVWAAKCAKFFEREIERSVVSERLLGFLKTRVPLHQSQ